MTIKCVLLLVWLAAGVVFAQESRPVRIYQPEAYSREVWPESVHEGADEVREQMAAAIGLVGFLEARCEPAFFESGEDDRALDGPDF